MPNTSASRSLVPFKFQATLIDCIDTERGGISREIVEVGKPGKLLDELVARRLAYVDHNGEICFRGNFIVSSSRLDPESPFLLRSEMAGHEIEHGEIVVIARQPYGSGGSRIVGMIAISLLAIYTGGAALAAAQAAGWSAAGAAAAGAAASVGVTIAGTLLVNAVLPLPKPNAATQSTQSPNYSLTSSGNTARINDPLPVQYGRFRVYPDYAAQPYTEVIGDDIYLYQLFCVTQGQVSIESINVQDTPITQFPEVQYQVVNPGETVTLFPDNVITSDAVSGVQLTKGAGFVGPYVLGPPGTMANRIAVDFTYPGGIYRMNDDGKLRTREVHYQVQIQAVDDNGNATGAWQTVGDYDLWLSDQKQGRMATYSFDVAPGRYQIQVQQLDVPDADGTSVDTVVWQDVRAYLPGQQTYGDATMLAVIMKASASLNSNTQREINVIGTRMLPVYSGGVWSAPQPTRNIAWAFADIFRNTTYGASWPDNKLNLDSLQLLAATWASRGDNFDGVFDSKTSIWDAATTIARTGRATPVYYAGVVDIIRDAPKTQRVLMLHPGNIVKGSLQLKYTQWTIDSSDYVIVTYMDPQTWKPVDVDCALDDSQKTLASRIDLSLGITDHDHAWREGIYMAACNRDQRLQITLTTELAGLVPQYGDLVGLTHDMPSFGQSGYALSLDVNTGKCVLSEPVQFSVGVAQHFVSFMNMDGSENGPYLCVQGDSPTEITLQGYTAEQLSAIWISDGIGSIQTAFAFGTSSTQYLDCVVLGGSPTSDGKVNLTLVNYSATVHIAETNTAVPPPSSPSNLLNQNLTPSLGGVGVNEPTGTEDGGWVWLSVTPVPGAVAYEFEISYDGGLTWQNLGISASNSIHVQIPPGTWIVRARAYGAGSDPGAWSSNPVTVNGTPWPLGALQSLTATEMIFGIRLLWGFPVGNGVIDAGGTEIRFGTTNNFNDSQAFMVVGYPTNAAAISGLPAGDQLYFWARLVSKGQAQPGPWAGPVLGQTSSDAEAILSYLTGQITLSQLGQDVLGPIQDISTMQADISDIKTAQASQESILEGLQVFSNPPMAGNAGDPAGASGNKAGVYTYVTARALGDSANAQLIQQVSAQVSDSVNTLTATVEQNSQVVASLQGSLSATYTVKAQINANGQITIAGMGLGVTADSSGNLQSSVYFLANQFALITTAAGGTTFTPFVIQNNQVFMSSAFIADGSITNAKIGNTIQSSTTTSGGTPTWQINKTGNILLTGEQFQIAHNSTGMHMTDLTTGVVVFEAGLLT